MNPQEVKIVNLTPHSITLDGAAGSITVPPSGTVAKVSTDERVYAPGVFTAAGYIPYINRKFGGVTGLPEQPENGAIYVVSSMVLSAVEDDAKLVIRWWAYLYAPDTGPTARRDEKGNVIAVTRLVGISL